MRMRSQLLPRQVIPSFSALSVRAARTASPFQRLALRRARQRPTSWRFDRKLNLVAIHTWTAGGFGVEGIAEAGEATGAGTVSGTFIAVPLCKLTGSTTNLVRRQAIRACAKFEPSKCEPLHYCQSATSVSHCGCPARSPGLMQMRLAERLEHEKQPEKSLEMRKSLIAAAAGVLASTFMVLGTRQPVRDHAPSVAR